MRSHWESRACVVGNFVAGIVLMFVGLFFLLTNLGIIQSTIVRVWWPVIPITVGVLSLGGLWLRPRKPYTDFA